MNIFEIIELIKAVYPNSKEFGVTTLTIFLNRDCYLYQQKADGDEWWHHPLFDGTLNDLVQHLSSKKSEKAKTF